MKKSIVLATIFLLVSFSAFAQESDSGFKFEAAITLGTDALPNAAGDTESWTKLGFQPDFSFGNFGIGLDLTARFQIYPSAGQALAVYGGDWIPDYEGNGKTFLDIYLPKLMYVRYGHRGDPLYAKLGSIDDFTLGDGFIVGEYANTCYVPEQRVFGLSLDVDGSLFQFPYVGAQMMVGNLARLDVVGARVFVRPLAGTGIPIMDSMQVGITAVADFDPALWYDIQNSTDTATDPIAVYGADVIVPIRGGKVFPLAAFTDFVIEPEGRWGSMIGAGGRLFSFITYGAQLRVLGPGFMPVYFDANYDIYRKDKYDVMSLAPTGDSFIGWFASLGFSVLDDVVAFKTSVDGPFKAVPSADTGNYADYPHLKAVATLEEGLVGGFSFNAVYEKYFLGKVDGFFPDLVSAEDAVITAQVNYHTGAAVLSLLYNLKYINGDVEVTSSIQSSIKF
jgi:hypothetical protein